MLRLSSITLLLHISVLGRAEPDYTKYVDPFLGSEGPTPGQAYGGGDTFIGAALPFGVVKLGIDTHDSPANESANNGGYTPQGDVTGISLLHESGTGGGPKYGYPAQMPLTSISTPVNILDNSTYCQARVGNDSASVGYYRTVLQNGVSAELAATRHAGLLRYSFPAGEQHVLVDLSHYLPYTARSYDSQFYAGGRVDIDKNNSIYTGYASVAGGWNLGPPVDIYFCGEFSAAPSEARTFTGRNTFPVGRYFRTYDAQPIPEPTYGGLSASSGPLGNRVGALFSWNSSSSMTLQSRIGVSFISAEKACAFKSTELPHWNFNATVQATGDEWNRDVFSKIQVPLDSTANVTRLRMLYSSLYFSHLIPSDRTGENPLWASDEPAWDDFYTMWDLSRNTVSLWHLIQPAYYASMIRSLIDIWRHEGFLPDGRSGNYNGLVQGGSNADNVLADAYVKGLGGGVNWTDAYAAMLTDAEVVPLNDNNPVDSTGSLKEGRSALDDWRTLGYVSIDNNNRAVSKSQEYAVNDFAVAQVAYGEAPQDVAKYLNRSAGWQRSWDHTIQSRGFTGFLAPRYSNGSFNSSYDLTQCGECNWADASYEATPFEYSFNIPHDMQTLITFMGGTAAFEQRLDYIFQPNTTSATLGPNGATSTIMNIGDEPDFLLPYLHHFTNTQHKSVSRVRGLIDEYFSDAVDGLPGNSDAGALNTWLLWGMLGLYPVVGTPMYLLGSPMFSDINVTVNFDRTLRIRATSMDEGMYVQGVRVNGEAWGRNWIEHERVMVEGGEIVFELGSKEQVWETGALPPSYGHVEL